MQKVILYYKFTEVTDPEAIRKWQTVVCAQRGLNGRIIVSKHGINGTLAGDKEALESYIEQMNATVDNKSLDTSFKAEHKEFDTLVNWPDFSGIEYKWSDGDYTVFPRLSVKHRDELVTLGAEDDFNPFNKSVGLRPKEWHEYIKNNPDVTILDARNDYESDIGKFKGAVAPKIKAFKELKPELEKLDKDKPLLTYCTGDIRCEYLSAYMKHKGFKEVYHLDGGIVKYGEEFGDQGYWDGKCFVFDKRMKLEFSEKSKDIGECSDCSEPTSEHTNCSNKLCNSLVLKCKDCLQKQPLCIDCVKAPVKK
ncbi:TPA: rhodanese domain-containing protein [Candidatus Saccharibacteria bacterium]|nr:rhodanese domain-containing protein [Candidatus Saccharibacteria bacterium]HIO87650.1 rhodanese domain-containing protein [Candidatus Saccharibacteria bacterium]